MWEKVVLHSHIENCYIQIEEMMNPQLKKFPIVIYQPQEKTVLAANHLAQSCNIQEGESLYLAYQKCSDLVAIVAHYEDYLFYTEEIKNIYREYTNYIENDDLGDTWIDLTQSQGLFGGNPEDIAYEIQRRVYKEFGICISIGVSFSKLFAKLAHQVNFQKKINVISHKNYKTTLYILPIESLELDRMTLAQLKSRDYHTIGDVAFAQIEELESFLHNQGSQLWHLLNDIEFSNRNSNQYPQSIGNGMHIPYELKTFDDMKFVLRILSETVATRLNDYGLKGAVIAIHIRNSQLKHFVKSKKLSYMTNDANEILRGTEELLLEDWFHDYQMFIGQSDCCISLSLRQLEDVDVIENEAQISIMDQLRKHFTFGKPRKSYAMTYNTTTI